MEEMFAPEVSNTLIPMEPQVEGAAEGVTPTSDVPPNYGPIDWISIAKAAKLSNINPGTISRAVDAREIRSNGIKGNGRKIDSADFNRWHLNRISKPDRKESDAKVTRQFENDNK